MISKAAPFALVTAGTAASAAAFVAAEPQLGVGPDEIIIAILSGLFGVVLVLIRAIHQLVLNLGTPNKQLVEDAHKIVSLNRELLSDVRNIMETNGLLLKEMHNVVLRMENRNEADAESIRVMRLLVERIDERQHQRHPV